MRPKLGRSNLVKFNCLHVYEVWCKYLPFTNGITKALHIKLFEQDEINWRFRNQIFGWIMYFNALVTSDKVLTNCSIVD